jgi:isopentenyl-diphosphate delta-isomerase
MNVELILVNESDEIVGYEKKLAVHQKGLLHRAFSVFIFNANRQLLIQQRSLSKYHSEGLWTNTCCSHPIKGENLENTVTQRLNFEMGINCPVEKMFDFRYEVRFKNGLVENELDYVYFGFSNDSPNPNPDEVMNFKWVDVSELSEWITSEPDKFTHWFQRIVTSDKFKNALRVE